MKLLCLFSSKRNINSDIETAKRTFKLLNQNIFIYDITDSNTLFATFTIEEFQTLPNNIISVHKKNEFNVFYTINALNKIIMNLNNGVFVKNYPLDWTFYSNQLLTINKEQQINRINFTFSEKIIL